MQKQVLNELKVAKIGCALIIRVLAQYIDNRATVITDALKQPAIQDIYHALTECDMTHGINIKRWLYDLETTYALLDDTIQKNVDRLFQTVENAAKNKVNALYE
jgi:hypothetical protein